MDGWESSPPLGTSDLKPLGGLLHRESITWARVCVIHYWPWVSGGMRHRLFGLSIEVGRERESVNTEEAVFIRVGLANCLSHQFKSAESCPWLLNLKMVFLRSQGFLRIWLRLCPQQLYALGKVFLIPGTSLFFLFSGRIGSDQL